MTPRSARTAALLAGVAVLLAYAVWDIRVSADFSAFLPNGATPGQRALIRQLREGVAGRLVLIDLAGAPTAQLVRASRALASTLEASPAFAYVANGDPAQAQRDFDFVLAHRYVLSPDVDAQRFSVAGLKVALAAGLEALYGSVAPLAKATLAQDPTDETFATLRATMPRDAPRSIDGVWFADDGSRALLVAATRGAASDLAAQSDAIAALKRAHAVADEQVAVTKLRYSSPGVLAVESRAIIADQAEILSLASVITIAIVLSWAYRAPRPVLVCAIPAVLGLLAGVCAVHAALGRVNGITLAFGATLLGEAVDYPSFLFTQAGSGESAREVRVRIAPVLRLAIITTACSGLALLTSGFPGLVELGVLTLVGILVAGALTWWFVPDWVPNGIIRAAPFTNAASMRLPLGLAWRWLALGAILALLALVHHGPAFDDDLSHLNPLPARLVEQDRSLRSALHAPDVRSLVLVRGADEQDVLRKTERLRPVLATAVASGEIGGFDLVSDALPSGATQAKRRAALPEAATLQANLVQAVAGTPFRLDAFAPFERDVAAARVATPLRARDLAGTALGLRVEALLGRDAEGWYTVVPLRDLARPQALSQRIDALRDPTIAWLDLHAESTALLRVYRQRALVSIALGVLLITGAIALGLRSVVRAIRVVVPVLAAIALATLVLLALGTELTIFHLVALLLVVGIGVNYALFADRATREPRESSRVAGTLVVVSATTLCAFTMLALSSIPVLRALGVTVVTGVVACLGVIAFLNVPTSRTRAP